jgi:hypothetical protein
MFVFSSELKSICGCQNCTHTVNGCDIIVAISRSPCGESVKKRARDVSGSADAQLEHETLDLIISFFRENRDKYPELGKRLTQFIGEKILVLKNELESLRETLPSGVPFWEINNPSDENIKVMGRIIEIERVLLKRATAHMSRLDEDEDDDVPLPSWTPRCK